MSRHLKLKMEIKIKQLYKDEKLLEKCKTVWTKIADLKSF